MRRSPKRHRSHSRLVLWVGSAACLVFLALIGFWSLLPCLRVYVDPDLSFEVDWLAFRAAFTEAGVQRVEILLANRAQDVLRGDLGPHGRLMAVGLVSRRGRDPLPYRDARVAGLGHTEGRVAIVHPDEVARFLWTHRDRYPGVPSPDWFSIRGHLFTNTAIREVWHAATDGGLPLPADLESARSSDPGVDALGLGTRYLPFTGGDRRRLEILFAPVPPWGEGLEKR